MNQRTAIIAGFTLIVGFLIGLAASSLFSTPVTPAREQTNQTIVDNSRLDNLRTEVASLQSENSDLTDKLQQAQPADPAVFSKTANGDYILPKDLLKDLNISATKVDHTLSDELIEFLKIKKEDVATLNAAIAASRSTVQRLQQSHEKVVSQTPNSVTISIPPLPEADALKNQLTQVAVSTLGQDRADYFMTQAPGAYYDLGDLGTSQETVTITANPDGTYSLMTVDKMANGASHSMGNTTPAIPPEYANLFQGSTADRATAIEPAH